LANEVGRLGIRVNAIAPGPIETPMVGIVSDEQRQAIAKNILLGRMGQPEDIGNAAVFLASDAASYITGATLPVSGGTDLKVRWWRGFQAYATSSMILSIPMRPAA
jgi:NAD(P)-dependent dehydrogenase (short-subunit alcohol dehydrogenase family)